MAEEAVPGGDALQKKAVVSEEERREMEERKMTNGDDGSAGLNVVQVLGDTDESTLVAHEVVPQDAVESAAETRVLVVGVKVAVQERLREDGSDTVSDLYHSRASASRKNIKKK